MTVESDINTLLRAITPKVYPDVAPMNTTPPFVTYQQVGGESIAFLDRTVPSKKHGRFQINVWASTRLAAAALALQIENAFLATAVVQAEPLGSPVATFEDETELFGTRQDFSVWSIR